MDIRIRVVARGSGDVNMKRRACLVAGVMAVALAALAGCRSGNRAEQVGLRSPNEAARIAEYERAARANPRNPRIYYDWGMALARNGDYKRAIARYQPPLALAQRR